MKILIIVLAVFVSLLCIFFLTSVIVDINYEKNELVGKGEIYVKYLFIKKKIAPISRKKETEEEEEDTENEKKEGGFGYYKDKLAAIPQIFEAVKGDLQELLRFCSKRLIRIKNLDFEFVFGLDDPMYTGIVNGIAYGVVYNILGFVHHNINVEKSNINIVPDFEKECFGVKLNCILRLKNVHIIVIIVKLIRIYYKFKKTVKNPSPIHSGSAEKERK